MGYFDWNIQDINALLNDLSKSNIPKNLKEYLYVDDKFIYEFYIEE